MGGVGGVDCWRSVAEVKDVVVVDIFHFVVNNAFDVSLLSHGDFDCFELSPGDFFVLIHNIFPPLLKILVFDSYNLLASPEAPLFSISILLHQSYRKDEDRTSKPQLRRAESCR
jgi:hypothetical protein